MAISIFARIDLPIKEIASKDGADEVDCALC
jgi:hypothetical protein